MIFRRKDIPADLMPYFVRAEIGLEQTPQEYVEELVALFREVRRVLRDDGTLWLNLGDSYCSTGGEHVGRLDNQNGVGAGSRQWREGAARADGDIRGDNFNRRNRNGTAAPGLKPKDLIGIPWRVAFALQADGWYLRQDIIWSKPNPMPESVKDRCTKAHEYVFMLSKSAHYLYDAEAISEPAVYAGLVGQNETGFKNPANFAGKHAGGTQNRGEKRDKQRGHSRRHQGFNDRWDQMTREEQLNGRRNKRSVWTIATRPFSEAHFATMAPELAKTCIMAGCPLGGTVLDPFGGAGTTGLVADQLTRNAILIELNPAYANMARKRISSDAGMFAEIS